MQRRYRRIHLSTGIVLMLTASALLWANMQRWRHESNYTPGLPIFVSYQHGWPFGAIEDNTGANIYEPNMTFAEWKKSLDRKLIYHPQWIAVDIAIALITFTSLAFVCECRIHRYIPSPLKKDVSRGAV